MPRFQIVLFIICQSMASLAICAENNELELDLTKLDMLSIDMDEFDIDDDNQRSDNWRLSLAWQNGADLNDLDETKSHRFDVRLDWGQLVYSDIFLKLDAKAIGRLQGDDNLDEQHDMETDERLRELYLQKSDEDWTITAGFQTITMGEMDAVQVTDLLSPWDYSEFAFTAPEDARLGQLMLNGEIHFPHSRLQLLYSPWAITNRYPGGDASALISRLLGSQDIKVNDRRPDLFDEHEFLLQWRNSIEGSDFTVSFADLLNNDPIFKVTSPDDAAITTFDTEYYRFQMLAFSANYSAGNLLWKMETAFKQNLKFQGEKIFNADAFDLALGADYDANGAWNLSLEIYNQRILSEMISDARIKQNNSQLLLRWSKNWLHETFTTIVFYSYQIQYSDMVSSLSFDYSIDDDWKASLVATVFESTDPDAPGQLTKNWDQLTFRLNYTY